MIRAVPALLSVFPRLNFAAGVQILIDDIPARIFLGVVVTGCQQKTERQDEDASESEHRGTFGREIIYVRLALVQGVLSCSSRPRPRERVRRLKAIDGQQKENRDDGSLFEVARVSSSTRTSTKSQPANGEPPNAQRQPPNAKRRTPNAQRQTPNAQRQTPNAKRRTPNAQRQTPNAKREPSHPYPETLQIIASWEILGHWHLQQARGRWEAAFQQVPELARGNMVSVQAAKNGPCGFDHAKRAF